MLSRKKTIWASKYSVLRIHNLLTEVGPHHNVPCAILRQLKGNN